MKKDLDKKIEALETAIETIQEALAELKVKQREIEVENAQQHVSKNKKEYIETVMEEKPKEEIVKIKEPLQEPELKQVDISAFKPSHLILLSFVRRGYRVYLSVLCCLE